MHVIGGLLLLTLARMSLSFSTSFWGNRNECSASISPNQYGAALSNCPVSSFRSLPLLASTQVTSPATIRDLKVTWSLGQNKRPQLHVTLDAMSPASAQEYNIVVTIETSRGGIYFTYCGKLSTLKPAGGQTQRQMITVTLDCLHGHLDPEKSVLVTVKAKGASTYAYKNIILPDCQDSVMYHSIYCVEQRKGRISFTLTQRGNSVQVMISSQTRYTPGSKLHLAIQVQAATLSVLSWSQTGSTVILTYPQTSATFSNLKRGETYTVLAWRPSNDRVRYEEDITLI